MPNETIPRVQQLTVFCLVLSTDAKPGDELRAVLSVLQSGDDPHLIIQHPDQGAPVLPCGIFTTHNCLEVFRASTRESCAGLVTAILSM